MEKYMKNGFAQRFNISQEVCQGLEQLGYIQPTDVQAEVIADVQAEKDLIIQSKTGSGKTAAFGIPIVDAISVIENLPQVLVLTPTRELAVQVKDELAEIGKYKKIRTMSAYGKQPIHIQLRQLKQRVHIVVGTPGRVADLIRKKHLNLEKVSYLVVDEADELLRRGFLTEVTGIIDHVPLDRTTLLLSATMPEAIEEVCRQYMNEPLRIEVENEEEPIEQIEQYYLQVMEDWKLSRLYELIETRKPHRSLVFCNTRNKVEQVASFMKKRGLEVGMLHGQMPQKERLRAIAAFKDERISYLVATDLAGRGIHIDKLDMVINYQIPKDPENYVHRIGRTGRAGEKGEAISLVNQYEVKDWQEIQQFIGYKVPVTDLDRLNKTKSKKAKSKDSSHNPQKQSEKAQSSSARQRTQQQKPQAKHSEITRLRINAGKKKKIRLGDIVGAISNLAGVTGEDIGIIEVEETCSYVNIHNKKGNLVMKELKAVKGKPVTIKQVKNK
jgi:superfamily II DNA/RNA helicase